MVDCGVDSDFVGGLDGHVSGKPVFLSQSVEGDGRDACIWVALLLRGVRDQLCNVLFQLCQVRRDVSLVKVGVLVVVLHGGHGRVELSRLEVEHKFLAEQLEFLELLLLVVDLTSADHNFFS